MDSDFTSHSSSSPFSIMLTSYPSLSPSPLTSHFSSHPMLSRMAFLLVCNLPSCHVSQPLHLLILCPSYLYGFLPFIQVPAQVSPFHRESLLQPLHSLHLWAWSLFTALVHPLQGTGLPRFPSAGRAAPESREHVSSAHRVCSSSGSTEHDPNSEEASPVNHSVTLISSRLLLHLAS